MTCMKQMVRGGLGFGVVPTWTIREEIARGEFKAAKLRGVDVVSRPRPSDGTPCQPHHAKPCQSRAGRGGRDGEGRVS